MNPINACHPNRLYSLSAPLLLAPRMMIFVHPIQPIQREVRINLRRRNVGMAENRLHRAQISTVLHHVRRTTVAQHVRAGMARRLRRRIINHLPHALSRDRTRSTRYKQKRRRLFRRQHRARILQILLHHLLRRLPQRDNALLVALASHQHVTQLQLQVFELQIDDLGNPQRAGIKHFQHRPIAHSKRLRYPIVPGARRPLQHALHLVGGQRLRQHLPLPRRIDIQRWIDGDVAVKQQILVEMPQRRQLARHTAPVDPIRQQRIEKVAHILPPRFAQRAFALQ